MLKFPYKKKKQGSPTEKEYNFIQAFSPDPDEQKKFQIFFKKLSKKDKQLINFFISVNMALVALIFAKRLTEKNKFDKLSA